MTVAQQLHRKNKTKAVTQSSLFLINLGGKRLLNSTFGVNIIKTTLGNASKQDKRGPWWNQTVLPSKKLDGSQTQLAGTLPSTREATVWPPGPRSSCISCRVFFSLLMQERQVFFQEWGWILQKKKKRLFIGTCLACFSSNSQIPAIRMGSSTSVFNTAVFTT